MKFFTRGEFAKLRNVAFNSLRYYEKLGLLRPARTDPETKYRYYAPEQLAELDTIQLCILLGIPLNRLEDYMDKDGNLQYRSLLEDGHRLMQEKVWELQSGINKVERALQLIDQNKLYKDKKGYYKRNIPKRTIFTLNYDGNNGDAHKIETLAAQLYAQAQEKNLSPILPMGQLFQTINGNPQYYLFFEIAAEHFEDDIRIMQLPQKECICHQVNLSPDTDLVALIKDTFKFNPNMMIVVSNIIFDKFCFKDSPCELQQYL